MAKSKAWTTDEIDAGIELYFAMLFRTLNGEKINKRAMIRHAQMSGDETLGYRTRGSIEMKLMNITACVESLDAPEYSMAEHGYRPLDSYQGALRIAVEKRIIGEYKANARKFRATS